MHKLNEKFNEKRKHVRIPAQFAILMKLDAEQFPNYTMEAEVINISEGGVLMTLPDHRNNNTDPKNQNYSFYYGDLQFESFMSWLQFSIPTSKEPIRVLGKPVWISKPGDHSQQCLLAMQFTHISSEDQSKINNFICSTIQAKDI